MHLVENPVLLDSVIPEGIGQLADAQAVKPAPPASAWTTKALTQLWAMQKTMKKH